MVFLPLPPFPSYVYKCLCSKFSPIWRRQRLGLTEVASRIWGGSYSFPRPKILFAGWSALALPCLYLSWLSVVTKFVILADHAFLLGYWNLLVFSVPWGWSVSGLKAKFLLYSTLENGKEPTVLTILTFGPFYLYPSSNMNLKFWVKPGKLAAQEGGG